MATPEELAAIIRFALSELSGRNGHHEFEELCRHFARARIATNVVPATGPVGAGGDQGRDLETFRSYLLAELGPHGAFLARSSDDTIVFMCTLQREGLTTKVRSDVDKIVSGGSAVDRIVAFLGVEMPVGLRHELQQEVQEAHGVSLDVLDVRLIGQELAQADIFWIAEQYLSLPSDLAPPISDIASPEWYQDLLDSWRGRTPQDTLAELLEIKSALRQATFHVDQRADLPFWLSLMKSFLGDVSPEELRRRAQYEVSVATLRGAGDLTPADQHVDEFMEHSCRAADHFALEDGCVLLMYAVGAFMRARTGLRAEQLASWNVRLQERVRSEMKSDASPNRRALLLQVLGHLNLQPDPHRIEVRVEPLPDVAALLDEDGNLVASIQGVGASAAELMVDLNVGMDAWVELTGLFGDASLFPIERFADYLSLLTPLLVDHPSYRELADAVDEHVANTAGRAAAAELCRDRAIALRRSNRLVAALAEFHQAKAGWWSGDSLRGSLLAMFLIADCYEQLGLLHAAKHSVLLAAHIAANSGDDDLQDLFARGVSIAGRMDYGLGNWCSSAATAEAGLLLHSNLVSPLDLDDPLVHRTTFELMWIYVVSRDLAPALAEAVRDLLERAGMWDFLQDVISDAPSRTAEEWLEVVGGQLHGELLADLKDELRISFSGLGTTWTLVGDNEPAVGAAMQRFAAAAQVLLAELASDDLALLRTGIHVRIGLGSSRRDRARAIPSNEGRHWDVELTPWSRDQEGAEEGLRLELLVIMSSILGEASLLPHNQFLARLEESFKRGLSHKIGFGPVVDALLGWTHNEKYEQLRSDIPLSPALQAAIYVADGHAELEWRGGPGPTYDHSSVLEAITSRYQRVPEQLAFTLARLKSDPGFRVTVRTLRERGWPDWQILNAVAGVALNHRLRLRGLDRQFTAEGPVGDAARAEVQALAGQPEKEASEALPVSAFSLEELEINRVAALPVLIRGFGLDIHQRTPDIAAIDHFLGERYGYWTDDIPHEDPFT